MVEIPRRYTDCVLLLWLLIIDIIIIIVIYADRSITQNQQFSNIEERIVQNSFYILFLFFISSDSLEEILNNEIRSSL